MRGNFFYKRLGERIIQIRNKKKLSQEQAALLSDIDRTYFARIEEGKANPSIKILNKIAKMFKVKVEDLLKGV